MKHRKTTPEQSKASIALYEELCEQGSKHIGAEREEFAARAKEAFAGILPHEGMPCSIRYYTDCRAATIVRELTSKKVEVMLNEVICTNHNDSEYEILPNLVGGVKVFTKRRGGQWVQQGQGVKGGVRLYLNYQIHEIDRSF